MALKKVPLGKCVLLLSVCVLFPSAVRSDSKSLTLEHAIAEALDLSPQLRSARASLSQAKWRQFGILGGGFFPKLSLSANHYFDITRFQMTQIVFGGQEVVFPGIFPNSQVGVSASIPIFDGFSNIHRLKAASLQTEAAEEELSQAEFELGQQIRMTFFNALAASDLETVALENEKTLKDHLRQIQIQQKGGAATNYDTLRVEVQMNDARLDALDAQDHRILARHKLAQLMGVESDSRALEGSLPIPNPEKLSAFQELHPGKRHDIQALEFRTKAFEQQKSSDNRWFVPSLSIGGQYVYYNLLLWNNGVTDNHNYQKAYNVGVFLNWNLFDGGVSIAKAREAHEQKILAENASEQARLKMTYDYEYWKRKYLSNSSRYVTKQLDVKRSTESVRLAKAEQRAGSRTTTEVLDAELDLYRSRAAVVNAQVAAAEALIQLELATGQERPL